MQESEKVSCVETHQKVYRKSFPQQSCLSKWDEKKDRGEGNYRSLNERGSVGGEKD